jgi:hypothetical protein
MAKMKRSAAQQISPLTSRLPGTTLSNPADTKLTMRRSFSGSAGLPESSLPGQAAPQHGESGLPSQAAPDHGETGLQYSEQDS